MKRSLAGLTSFFLALGGIYFGLDFAMPQAQAAPTPTARLIQVLGHFSKFVTGPFSDSEFRLDFVLEVPTGSIKSNGDGLDLWYDFNGTYSGPTPGNGVRVANDPSGWWIDAGSNRITTPNLGWSDINQQYRIIRIDKFGDVDRVTLSLQGDLGGNFDASNPTSTGSAPYSRPVTMQARIGTSGNYQYVSYQYQTTTYNVSTTYDASHINQKVAAHLGWDNLYATPFSNSQTSWGYVVNDANPKVPAQRMWVAFISPWDQTTAARDAGVCTSATSFYYQWIRNDGTGTNLTPTPQLKAIDPAYTHDQLRYSTTRNRIVDMGEIDFSAEGPGYYQLVAWPIAVNPSLSSDPTSCSDYSYYIDSVGDLESANAFTVGSVFYTGGSMAVGVEKSFSPNPMPYQGTSSAVFTLDSEGSHISGVGFTDTFPSDLYLTGKIIRDTCDLQSHSITQAQIDALDPVTAADIKANVKAGSWLMLTDEDADTKLDTVKVQGGIAYSLQTGKSQVIGTSVPLGKTCVVEVEVAHKDTIKGNSVCKSTTTPTSQTNDESNVSYTSMSTVLAYDAASGDREFGECLSITRQSDLFPTGASANILAGTTVPLSTVVTSTGPSPIDTASVKITAPLGTTLTSVSGPTACFFDSTNTLATCETGPMDPGDTLTYNYSVVVPSGASGTLNGTVSTTYGYDTDTTNDSQPITLTTSTVDLSASDFSVSSADITANDTDSGTITATLVDTTGVPMTGVGSILKASLVADDGKTTISGFTETGTPGTYTANITSTMWGDKQVAVTASGDSLTASGNDIAHFIAGLIDPSKSTFTVTPVIDPADKTSWKTADGTDFYTGTLTARDANNNPISTLDPADIKFTSTSSDVTVSGLTNQGSGVYTIAYKSLVADSSPKALLSVGTTPIGAAAGLPTPFKAGAPVVGPIICSDPSKKGTNLSVDLLQVGVGGTSTATALITDINCNPVPDVSVGFTLDAGTSGSLTVVSGTTNASGIATATVTDKVAEKVKLHAQITAGEISGSPQEIEFVAGSPDPAQSSLSLSSPTAVVGQTISATVTVKDAGGNVLSGEEVTVTLDGDATVGAVGSSKVQTGTCLTDLTGMCSVAFTDPTAETVNVTAQVKVGSTPSTVSGSPKTATFTSDVPATTCTNPNKPLAEQTNVSANPTSLSVGGSSTVRAYVTDKYCNPVTTGTINFGVNLSGSLGAASVPITNGVATTTVTDSTAETVNVTAQVDGGFTLPNSPVAVTFNAGAVDPSESSFAVSSGPVVADGVSTYSGTFTARDSAKNLLKNLTLTDIVFGSSSADVTVSSPVVNNGDGTYTVTYKTTVASDAYKATLNYKTSKIGADLPIPFVSGAVSAASAFTVLPSSQTVGVPVTLTLTVKDAFNNPINNLTQDKFQLSSSNASGAPELVYGSFTPLANGVYTFTTTSTKVESFTFTAVVNGVELTAKPLAQFVAAGVSASTSYFDVTVNDQLADGKSQDKATAYAKDQYGNPVSGAPVEVVDKTTGANAGKLTPGTAKCTTDTSGSCDLKWTADAVGLYAAEGTIASLSPGNGSGNLDIRFSVGNISAYNSELVVTPSSLTVGDVATATVTIRDMSGILVPGGVATFSLETSLPGASAGGPSLSGVTCVTGASGTCSVTVTSQLAGDVKVHATVPQAGIPTGVGGFGDPVKGSPVPLTFTPGPVCFTGCTPVDPSHVTRVEVTTNGVSADGVAQDVATAYAYDAKGNPVPGVAVATSSLDSGLNIVSASVVTGADGTATLAYTSTKAGPHKADVTIDTKTPTGSPVTLVFGSGTADPSTSTLSVSPSGPIQVEQSYTITAHINDAKSNPVDGAFVAFSIPGNVTPSASTCTTDASGTCDITVTSTVAGSYDISAELSTGALSNSPVKVAFTAGAVCFTGCTPVDPRNTTRVELTMDGQPADGVSPDVAVVYAYDRFGNPVQGAAVASVSTPDVKVGTIAPTGADGSTTIQYTSTVATIHSASVMVAGGTPAGSPVSPAFSALGGLAANSSWTMTPSGPLVVGKTASSTYTATTTVRDVNKNVVSGAVVTLKSVQPGVTFPAGATCTTNSSGVCTVEVYSTVAGTFDFTSLLGADQIGTSASAAWAPDAVCAVASGCTPEPGVDDAHKTRVVVTTNNVTANGVAQDVATVYAFDQYGNPVPNALVLTDKVISSDALTHQTGVIQTDSSGVVTVWYTSPVAGDHLASVSVGGAIPANGVDNTGHVTLNFVPGPVTAANSSLAVDKTSVSVGGTVTATATTRDANNNLVSGVEVSFGKTGSASLSNPSCTTDSTGTCTVTLTDSVAEPVQVSATVLDGGVAKAMKDSPRTVTFGVGAVSAASAFTVLPASQTVGVPVTLTLAVKDALGNPINGLAADKFKISSVNASGVSELSYKDFTPLANGVYTLTTTSTTVASFTFTAEVDGVTLTAKPTAAFTAAGVSASTSGFVMTVNDQLADGKSKDTATAYAKDQYGNPVAGAVAKVVDKTTGVNAGVLNPDTASCTTDASGSCELSWTATAVGAYVGEGTIASLTPGVGSANLDIRFSVGNISAYNSELVVSPSPLTVGGTATATVTIRDTSGILVPGGVASFSLESSLSGAGAPSLSTSTCTTDASGMCSVTVTSLLAGDVKVHATVPQAGVPIGVGGFGNPVKGSPVMVTFTAGPVCFTGCSPVDPTHLTRVEVTTNGVAADGKAQDVATAYAYDAHGNPVSGAAVATSTSDTDLKIVSGSVTTGADGTATLAYTSTKAGSHSADVTIAAQGPAGSPVTLVFGSGTAVASTSTLSVSPAGSIAVGQDYTITAHINDVNSNPVDGAFVAFQIPGNVTASKATCITDSSGTCSITVTSTVAGSYDISAELPTGPLSNSPVKVTYTAGPVCFTGCTPVDPKNTTRVELTVNGEPADGVSPDVAVVYAFDKHGNPVPGAVVVSTSTPDLAVGTIAPTGADGTTTIQYTSTVAGVHSSDVTVDSGIPAGSPLSLAFSAQGGKAEKSSWSINPSGPLVVGTDPASTYTASITIRDEFNNPVPGAVATLKSVQSGVTFPAGATCTTDVNGQCTVEVYSTVAGTYDFTALLGPDQIGVSQSRAWSPDAVCAVASGCTPEPGVDAAHTTRVEVTTNQVAADDTQHDIVTVYAFDKYGNPVPAALVLTDKVNTADVLTHQSGVIETDNAGVATIWYSSTVAGDHEAWVTVGGTIPANGIDDTGYVTLTFVPGGASAANSTLAVDKNSVTVGGTVTATATTRDAKNNLVSGVVVSFGASGSASLSDASCTTDSTGTCTLTITDNVAEPVQVSATVVDGGVAKAIQDSPATVTFGVGAVSADSAFTVSPASQTVGVDVVLSLAVQDALGNPINGLTRDKFVLSSSNPSGVPELTYDAFTPLAHGVYTFTTTSTKVEAFTFSAVVDGVALKAQPSAQFVAAGVSASTSYFDVTVNDQLADGKSLDKAVAYAKDQYGNPVAGAQVDVVDKTTGVNAGVLNPWSTSCTTDATGTCELTWSATSVGAYVGEGTIDSLSPGDGSGILDIRFSVGNISAEKSDLVVSPSSLTAGGTATATVTIRDTSGILVPGGVATFFLETTLPGGAAGGPSLSAVICTTNAFGTCSVTVSSLLAGDVKVHATVPVVGVPTGVGGNGDPVKGSPRTVTFVAGPVCFTGCNPVDPTHTTHVEVTTNGVAADGKAQDVATAYAYDTNGNPVSGVAVATSSTDPTLTIVSASATTGADGTATLAYRSTKAGSHYAVVTIASQTPVGSPVALVFGAGSADPSKSTLSVLPASPIVVDHSYTITANVKDASSNPVDGAFVAFQIPANVSASAPTCITGASGTCSISVTSTVAGSYEIGAVLPGGALSNSPVTVGFTAGPVCMAAVGCMKDPGVDAAHTTRVELTVNGQPADGVSPDVAVVYAFDKHGNPVPGAVVASTSSVDVVVGTIAPTGADGVTTIQYTSTVAGVHSADVTVDGGTPDGSPLSPLFSAQGAWAANSSWSINPSGPLVVGTDPASTYTASMTVRDKNNNVIQGAVVTLKSVQPGVTFPAGATCTTNAKGECSVDVYSTVAGTYDFTALLGPDQIGVSESRAWAPDAVCAIASGCTPQPGVDDAHTTRVAVTTNNVNADGVQHDVATVYAFDQYGNPVPNALVQSTSADADLTIQSGAIQTNTSGVATIWYATTVGGNHFALVTVGGAIPDNGVDNTGMVTLNFLDVTAPSAPTIDSPTDGDLTNDDPLTVEGTAEPGSTVEVVDETGATVCAAAVDAAGKWTCQVTLPDGDHTLTATATDGAGNKSADSAPVDVTVDLTAPSAPRVDTANGTEVAGGAGSSEPGATITVTWPDGSTDTVKVNPDGSWTIPTPPGMPSGEISVTATDPAGNTSSETKENLDTLPPLPPIIDEANGTHVTGTAEPDSKITVTWPDGTTSVTTVDPGGNWSVPTPPGTPSGEISVTATDPAGNTSPESKAYLDTDPPGAPVVNPSDGSFITGQAEPGSTITIVDEDGDPVLCQEGVVTAGTDGGFICTPFTPLPRDTVIDVVATDKAGNASQPAQAVIGELAIRTEYPVLESTGRQVVIGTGFIPGETVTLDFCSTCTCVGTGIADITGMVRIEFDLPEGTHAGSHIVRLTGEKSVKFMGPVETTFVVEVIVETGASAMTSSGSAMIGGASGAAAMLLAVWGVEVIPPTLRKSKVGA